MNDLFKAALEYEARGYSVIPLKPKDKIPLIPSWTPYQTERAGCEQIGTWWRSWRDANIGVVTGAISGLFVIDCDSPEAATALKPLLGDMSAVGVAATGKGFHLYYAHGAAEYPNKAAIRPSIDFRGDGGYVVAPPSIHANGKAYEWAKPINGHLRELPEEFIALMSAPPGSAASKAPFDTAGAISGLADGQRDTGMFKLACKLRGADVPYVVALELCEQAARNCDPPFPNAARKVDQAYKYPAGHSLAKAEAGNQETLWPMPITMREFRQKISAEIDWVWGETWASSQIMMIAGQTRAGKSMLALNIALAISRGAAFLGRPTQKARVLYLNWDNTESDFRIISDQLGIQDNDDILIHSEGPPPNDPAQWLAAVMKQTECRIVVIDTFQKFHSMKDLNDNAEAERAMSPLIKLVKENNYLVLYVHHMRKGEGLNLTGFLGATQIKANCQQYMELTKIHDKYRIITSDFRNGLPFDRIYVKIDRQSGWNVAGGSADDAEVEMFIPRILELLAEQTERISEAEIKTGVDCSRPRLVSMALRKLEKDGEVNRVQGVSSKGRKAGLWALSEKLFEDKIERGLFVIK